MSIAAENARIAIAALVRLRVMVDWVRALRFWMRSFFSEGVSGFIPRDSWRILSWVVSVSLEMKSGGDVGESESEADSNVEDVSFCALLLALEMKSSDDD